MMVVLIPVGVGSAPGEPSGRWVAGCRASGLDFDRGDQVVDPAEPLTAGAGRPHHTVDGPQQRFEVAGPMVVDDRIVVADDGGDALVVTGGLGRVLGVEHPRPHVPIGDQSGCGDQEMMSSGHSIDTSRSSEGEDDSVDLKLRDDVEEQSPPAR